MWEGPQCPDQMSDGKKKIAALRQLPPSEQLPHSKNLRLHRWTDASATFFITKPLHPKRPALNPEARAIVVSAFRFAVEDKRIYLRAFVVMPDHWHALFALREPWTLPKFVHDFMSYVGRKTNRLLRELVRRGRTATTTPASKRAGSLSTLLNTSSRIQW